MAQDQDEVFKNIQGREPETNMPHCYSLVAMVKINTQNMTALPRRESRTAYSSTPELNPFNLVLKFYYKLPES